MFIRGMGSALMHGVEVESDFAVPYPHPQSYPGSFTSFREAQSSSHKLWNATLLHFRKVAASTYGRLPISVDDAERKQRLIDCHDAWYKAFEALELTQDRIQKLSLKDKIAFSPMKMAHWGAYIFLNCAEDTQQMSFDTYLPLFKILLHHARLVLETPTEPNRISSSQPAAAKFTFEIAVIPALQFTATRCRCSTTRREALRLLSLNPPREGLWDAEQHAAVSKRIIELEETKVDERGWPVEETRIWSATIDSNMDCNGGFWVTFCPVGWIGCFDEEGKQKVVREWFTLVEPDKDTLVGQSDTMKTSLQPDTDPLSWTPTSRTLGLAPMASQIWLLLARST